MRAMFAATDLFVATIQSAILLCIVVSIDRWDQSLFRTESNQSAGFLMALLLIFVLTVFPAALGLRILMALLKVKKMTTYAAWGVLLAVAMLSLRAELLLCDPPFPYSCSTGFTFLTSYIAWLVCAAFLGALAGFTSWRLELWLGLRYLSSNARIEQQLEVRNG